MKFTRPYDMSRFRKEQNKKLAIKDGFFDPLMWIDTGNYALNKMMSGDFFGGVPIGSVTTFAGESGSGKSYIVSGNVVRNAMAQGACVMLLDTEGAVKRKWAQALGVDTDNDQIVRWSKKTINEVAKVVADFMDGYIKDVAKMDREEQPPVLFVIDSLGNLDTETSLEQFKGGDLKGDKGIFAKQLKAMLKSTMGMLEGYQVGMVCTNHTYKNQNQYSDHEDIISGGSGPIYLSDIVVSMNKSKLKGESAESVIGDDGKKKKGKQQYSGITSKIKCVKSRYAKPFEEVEIQIPYTTGMDPYSGLFEMFIQKKLIWQDGKRFLYNSKEKGEVAATRKQMDNQFFDMLLREYDDADVPVGVDETPEDADVE